MHKRLTVLMVAKMTLGDNVKLLRQERGLTQMQLADLCGTKHPQISEIENGRANPTLSTLTLLAEKLGTTVDKLLRPRALKKSASQGL